jgi:hypothetical protein
VSNRAKFFLPDAMINDIDWLSNDLLTFNLKCGKNLFFLEPLAASCLGSSQNMRGNLLPRSAKQRKGKAVERFQRRYAAGG